MPIAIVTGGSRGIGAATCRLAAELGYDVCFMWHKAASEANAVCDSIRERGRQALAIQVDVSRDDQVLDAFGRCDEELGTLDVLVNNAGVIVQQARVEDFSVERVRRILDVNVLGSVLCAREAVRRMSTARGGKGGAIVNVSSVASRTGSPGEYADYAASKGAIDSFTLGLAREVGSEGIRVNAVRPGFIDTGIHAAGGEPARLARLAPNIPLRRGGEAGEVAQTIMWLASGQASYVNGAIVDVAGGV